MRIPTSILILGLVAGCSGDLTLPGGGPEGPEAPGAPEPDRVRTWWGILQVNLRVGGAYVMAWQNPGGPTMHAVITACEPPRLLETEGDIHGRLRWELDPDCDAARLPPLLLQPLVENAVRYGVEPNEEGGSLLVRTRRTRAGGVELLVRNSLGAAAPGGHGLALANVKERLALLHDLEADLRVEAETDRFSVRLRLPGGLH